MPAEDEFRFKPMANKIGSNALGQSACPSLTSNNKAGRWYFILNFLDSIFQGRPAGECASIPAQVSRRIHVYNDHTIYRG